MPERSRKQQQRGQQESAWPLSPCLLMWLLPTMLALVEIQLLVLEPPGLLEAGM